MRDLGATISPDYVTVAYRLDNVKPLFVIESTFINNCSIEWQGVPQYSQQRCSSGNRLLVARFSQQSVRYSKIHQHEAAVLDIVKIQSRKTDRTVPSCHFKDCGWILHSLRLIFVQAEDAQHAVIRQFHEILYTLHASGRS